MPKKQFSLSNSVFCTAFSLNSTLNDYIDLIRNKKFKWPKSEYVFSFDNKTWMLLKSFKSQVIMKFQSCHFQAICLSMTYFTILFFYVVFYKIELITPGSEGCCES